MLSYNGSQEIKDKYVSRMEAHIKADELIRGVGFNEKGKGCAVGCTLNKYDHAAFETELGIPEWMARCLDTLFEGMNFEKSKTYPLIFLETIQPGKDLDKLKAPFLIYILESLLDKFDNERFPDIVKSINDVIELYKSNETNLEKFEWAAARAAAWAAAWAARASAWADERAARASARDSARAAAWADERADERAAAYDRYADYLIKLIQELD